MSCRQRRDSCTGNAVNSAFTSRLKFRKVYDAWFPLSLAYRGRAREYVNDYVAPVSPNVSSEYNCTCGLTGSEEYASTIALHLRCADVPFSRHRDYHLPDPAFFDFVLARLKTFRELHGVRSLLVLNSSDHVDKLRVGQYPDEDERRACDELADAIATYYRRHRFAVMHFQGSAPDALQAMLGAHALVATSPSSFSFFAGLTKPASRFITTDWYREEIVKPAVKAEPQSKAVAQLQHLPPASPPCGVSPQKFAQRFVAFQYVGRSHRDGTPCPGPIATRAVHADNLSQWVPWTVFREPRPLLHGQVANRAAYVTLVDNIARGLRAPRLGGGLSQTSDVVRGA